MELQKALDIIHSLIEQTNGNGFFKKLADLDAVRKAEQTIIEHLAAQSKEKKV